MLSDKRLFRFHVPALNKARAVAWCVLTFERLWPRILPAILALMVLVSLAWFGVFDRLSYWPHLILCWALLFIAVGSPFVIPGFHLPSRHEVDRRIEKKSGFKNQPLEALYDTPVNGGKDVYAQALWAEHQRRMAAELKNLQTGMPDTKIARFDPFALRSIVILFTVVAFAYSFSTSGGRLSDLFDFSAPVNLSSMRVDAWVTPPSYTGQAPIYLTKANLQSVEIPEGSKVTINVVDGGDARLKLKQSATGKTSDIAPIAEDSVERSDRRTFETVLKSSGELTLSTRHYDKNWSFNVVADHPPMIKLAKEPGRILNGSLELDYVLDDDYGVEKAYVEITPTSSNFGKGHPLYAAPQIPLLIPRGGKGHARTVQDVSNDPWAGSEVRLTLVAEDGAGHIARSETRTITLPQRSFGNPLARAVVEQRRLLALDTLSRNLVLDMLSALTLRPDETINNFTHYLALRSIWTRLHLAETDEALKDVSNFMWQTAIGIEGDAVNQAEKNLKAAQSALRDALRNGASSQEIERLTEALRQAMNDYIAALAEQAQNDGLNEQPSNKAQNLSPDELAEKLKQLEDMAKLGNRAGAEQLLSELEQLMDNLQVRAGNQGSGEGKNKTDRMQKQLDKLGDLMRRQQEVLNDTHKLEDEQERGEKTPEEYRKELDELQKKQENLQSELQQLGKDLSDQGFKADDKLNDAENKMAQSGKALEKGDAQTSAEEQSKALEAMRHGATDLMKEMQEAMKKNGETVNGEDDNAKDPLGRKLGSTGGYTDKDGLSQESEMQRARRILDEIRKKLGQSTTDGTEKNYLERLLNFD
ncbi:TIGR02302 family protein [uncultured Bartonella sp.]|uniref:TIGR02302 family protein n=1 Tax=uncultured Bartonella sp. TaxID=104108 RepID=UPI00261008B3|nr:TIGR02302 family protein [uncultured Bartonella sp.]